MVDIFFHFNNLMKTTVNGNNYEPVVSCLCYSYTRKNMRRSKICPDLGLTVSLIDIYIITHILCIILIYFVQELSSSNMNHCFIYHFRTGVITARSKEG